MSNLVPLRDSTGKSAPRFRLNLAGTDTVLDLSAEAYRDLVDQVLRDTVARATATKGGRDVVTAWEVGFDDGFRYALSL